MIWEQEELHNPGHGTCVRERLLRAPVGASRPRTLAQMDRAPCISGRPLGRVQAAERRVWPVAVAVYASRTQRHISRTLGSFP